MGQDELVALRFEDFFSGVLVFTKTLDDLEDGWVVEKNDCWKENVVSVSGNGKYPGISQEIPSNPYQVKSNSPTEFWPEFHDPTSSAFPSDSHSRSRASSASLVDS
jgi:hypothetical protein